MRGNAEQRRRRVPLLFTEPHLFSDLVNSIYIGVIFTLDAQGKFLERQKVTTLGLMLAGPCGPSIMYVFCHYVLPFG